MRRDIRMVVKNKKSRSYITNLFLIIINNVFISILAIIFFFIDSLSTKKNEI